MMVPPRVLVCIHCVFEMLEPRGVDVKWRRKRYIYFLELCPISTAKGEGKFNDPSVLTETIKILLYNM